MTSHKTHHGSVAIYHECNPGSAAEMIITGVFRTFNNVGGYDGGMNFCGVLGLVPNTQPVGEGAKLHCLWIGPISESLPPASYNYSTPNILYDFNGSGNHYQNNDPRWFLPYGSVIVIKGIECNPSALEVYYLSHSKWLWRSMYKISNPAKRKRLLQEFYDHLNDLCSAERRTLRIERGHPTRSNGGEFFGKRLDNQ